MNSKLHWLAIPLLALAAASCDKEDAPATTEWQDRNYAFLDSLAAAYDAQQADPSSIAEDDTIYKLTPQHLSNYTIYYKKLGVKDGFIGVGETAKFTDVARVYYQGRLIDGTMFDSNFSDDYPDYELDIPSDFIVSGLQASSSGIIQGWTEILQVMRPAANKTDRKGDFFRVYIRPELAYGAEGSGSIQGYSTLIFDINLLEVNPE